MNREPENTDAAWLASLMGNQSSKDSDVHTETGLVREALDARTRRLDDTVPVADEKLFQRIRGNLESQGVIREPEPQIGLWGWLLVAKIPVWGAAAMAFLAAGLMLALNPFHSARESGSSGIYSFATVVTAADPKARMTEILNEVLAGAATTSPGTYRGPGDTSPGQEGFDKPAQPQQILDLGRGRMMTIIEASPKALQRLKAEGIEPTVTDGRIVLIVEPK
jgi:hypothetical protein